MSWFKVDDKLHSHPKFLKAGLEAMGLWLAAGSYSADYGTGGRVDLRAISRLSGDVRRAKSLASKLVLAGLWRTIDADVWMFHDWNVHNYSEEEEAEKKAKRRASGRLGGLSTAEKRRVQALANATALAETLLPYAGKQTATPSRPDPVPSLLKKEEISEGGPEPVTEIIAIDRDGEYRDAFSRGIAAGTGRPFTWPKASDRDEQGALNSSLRAFAKDPATGRLLRGAKVLEWIHDAARAFAKEQATNEVRYRTFKAVAFVAWLNRGPAHLDAAPLDLPPQDPFIHPDACPCPPEDLAKLNAAMQALHDKPSALEYLGEKK